MFKQKRFHKKIFQSQPKKKKKKRNKKKKETCAFWD